MSLFIMAQHLILLCYDFVDQGGAKPDAGVCHHGAICAAGNPVGVRTSLSGGVCGARLTSPQTHYEDD